MAMSLMGLHSRVRPAAEILGTQVGGETVLMNPQLGEYYTLDSIAADIWRRLEGGIVLHELIRTLALDYSGDPGEIQADVLALLSGFADKGLIIITD